MGDETQQSTPQQDSAPDPNISGVDASQPQQAPDMGQPTVAAAVQPTPPPAPRGGMWARVLQGALAGLASGHGGLIERAGEGALQPTRAIAQEKRQDTLNDMNVKWKTAQAAAAVANASADEQLTADLPQHLQDLHNEAGAKVVDDYTKNFGDPTLVVADTAADVKQKLENITQTEGGVDHMLIVHSNGNFYAWNTETASKGPGVMDQIHKAGAALGLDEFINMTPAIWKSYPATKRAAALDTIDDLTGVTTYDRNKYEGQKSRLTTWQKTLAQKVPNDPTLQPTLDHVTVQLDNLEKAHDNDLKMHTDQVAADAAARAKNKPPSMAGANLQEKVYEFNDKAISAEEKPVKERLARMATLHDTLAQGTPQADALIAPELLSTMAAGAGSGVRINEAEIERVVGGRTYWEDIKSKLLRFQADPNSGFSLTSAQRVQVGRLLDTVNSRLQQKQAIYDKAHEDLRNASDPSEIKRIRIQALKDTAAVDLGRLSGKSTPTSAPKATPAVTAKPVGGGKAAKYGVPVQ